jgi:hypothetical protein
MRFNATYIFIIGYIADFPDAYVPCFMHGIHWMNTVTGFLKMEHLLTRVSIMPLLPVMVGLVD